MATDITAARTEEPDRGRDDRGGRVQQDRPAQRTGGFFSVYKKGHGYWTRMGTAIGAGLVGLLGANFLFQQVPVWMQTGATYTSAVEQRTAEAFARNVAVGVAAAFILAFAALAWWLMNKPANADFLIATDGEMKRVNWTSRKELIGSTKVVILFMFLIAGILFAIDVVFGYFFYFLQVLKFRPLF